MGGTRANTVAWRWWSVTIDSLAPIKPQIAYRWFRPPRCSEREIDAQLRIMLLIIVVTNRGAGQDALPSTWPRRWSNSYFHHFCVCFCLFHLSVLRGVFYSSSFRLLLQVIIPKTSFFMMFSSDLTENLKRLLLRNALLCTSSVSSCLVIQKRSRV